ncbi:SusC/RagA family TonB-linked outer membrane protein [Niabella ginsenosidivorans]|uniref:SusC/RagA family TonB-linked outer membrane protein n=1 Tax=Niabella ginsenosidivorans TaxID=1176587 RepID=A0A1A9HX61_9BACT|nr:TonB-dependent receptor [Niabella ginsenosidivorans]ANH79998.1 SusC/RagA family TonB-linked outer membrane protein [Niabella ginsenosidivorans]
MHKIPKHLLLLAIAFIPAISLLAQKKVNGKVLSEAGENLSSVTITVQNATTGEKEFLISDSSGIFSIPSLNAGEKYNLYFEHVGYANDSLVNYSLSVNEASSLLIRMKPLRSTLEEVVVVGYGTQKKSEMIGSVAQVGAKQINNRTAPSLSNILTGQLPGVTLIQRSGQPGSDGATIQVRGVGSFGASPNPFILVDGVPVNSFNDINPNDVASVSVLKDASTAAIYGSRASNGVILVTTKSGEGNDGKVRVNYNAYYGAQKPTAYPRLVDAATYATLMNEAIPNSYTAEDIQKFKDGSDPYGHPNNNWIDQVFKKSAPQTAHNISISNKTKNTDYLMSFGFLDQKGIVSKNDYDRYSVRVNMTNRIWDKLTLTSRMSGAQYIDNQPAPPANVDINNMLDAIGQAVRTPPVYATVLSDGSLGLGLVNKGTPYTYLNNPSFYKNKQTDLMINERLDYNVIPDLKLSLIGAYSQLAGNSKRYLSTFMLTNNISTGPGNLTLQNQVNTYKTLQELVEYKKTIARHQFSILAGHTYEFSAISSSSASRSGYTNNDLTELVNGDAATQGNTGTSTELALDSYFGRLNYSFGNRYLIEGVLRYDGSSRFPSSKKYAAFPAVAVGWRLSEEKFLKNKVAWLNELKLKASYGTLGNQNLPTNITGLNSYYPYQSLLSPGFNYPFGGTTVPGVANTTLVDSNLHWESTRTKDIGLEATIFRGLNISVSYFDRYTYDIIVSPGSSVSSILGFTPGPTNGGELSNTGWEFTLGYNNHVGDFSYTISGNLSIINNKVLDLGVGNVTQPNGLVGNGTSLFIGYPMQMYYGYVADGLFKDASDIAGYADQKAINPTVQPGDIRYKDISGPDGVPDGKVDATYDRTFLGSQIPKYQYGINISLNYKNFDLSVTGQGVAAVKGQLNNYAGYAFYNNGTVQQFIADDHWSKENPNPNARYPRLEVLTNAGSPNTLSSSFYLLNAGYFKIRNIQLGYSLPSSLLKDGFIKSLRVNASAQNAVSFNKYPKGWDPEVNSSGAFYPIMANYSLGLNVNF